MASTRLADGSNALYEPLELVSLLSGGGRRVKEVNGERLHEGRRGQRAARNRA